MDSTLVALYPVVTGTIGAAIPAFRSGQTLAMQYPVVQSEVYNRLTGNVVLPPLVCDDTNRITQNAVMEGTMCLPIELLVTMALGSRVSVELPPVGLSAHITNPIILRGAIRLPALASAGQITTTGLLRGAVTLPVLTVAMRVGWSFSPKVLPALASTGHFYQALAFGSGAEAGGAIVLPALRASGSWHQTQGVLTGHIMLPALAGAGASIYDAEIALPPLRAGGQIMNGTVATSRAWAMNLSNKAVTQFLNFPFRQMAYAFNEYSAVGFDGNLYDFGGDEDAGAKINWQWRTGISDLNTRGLKGVLGYYIDGIIESKITVDLVLDTGVFVYRHDPRGVPNDYKTHRISIGRGLRSSNVGIGAAGDCYIAIDSVTPDYVVSNRNL
jgi:hypothetical protein